MKWTESYNCHRLQIAPGLAIGVNWSTNRDDPGYRVSFNGVSLKKSVDGLDKAKQAGFALAEKLLTEALSNLAKAREETHA